MKKRYTCIHCSKSFKTKSRLTNHKCNHCKFCQVTFLTFEKYCNHNCDSKYGLFICKFCRANFSSNIGLQCHDCTFCEYCEVLFASYDSLLLHKCRIKLYVCNLCVHSYSSGAELKSHQCTFCKLCGQNFDSLDAKTGHNCKKTVSNNNNINDVGCLESSPPSNKIRLMIENVMDVGSYINDEVITNSYELMRKHNRGDSYHIGAYTPVEIDFNMELMDPVDWPNLQVPNDKNSIMIHFLGNHWVTSYYDVLTSSVFVYDSLQNYSDLRQRQLLQQLKMLYGVDNPQNVKYVPVTQQGSDPLCGALAVAFAFTLLLGKQPQDIQYDIEKVRDHLGFCLLEEKVLAFPYIRPLEFDKCIRRFYDDISVGPTCICTVCARLLFRNGVKVCVVEKYRKLDRSLKEKVFKENVISAENKIWICHTCHNCLLKNKLPAQAKANGLELAPIPTELQDLNSLEIRLISKRLPFMKIVALPGGRQKGIHGPVINVPSKVDTICSLLPRMPSDANIIPLKLKKKLSYTGYYMYEYIRPHQVIGALSKLKEIHPLYGDVTINTEWQTVWCAEDAQTWERIASDTAININGLEQDMDTNVDLSHNINNSITGPLELGDDSLLLQQKDLQNSPSDIPMNTDGLEQDMDTNVDLSHVNSSMSDQQDTIHNINNSITEPLELGEESISDSLLLQQDDFQNSHMSDLPDFPTKGHNLCDVSQIDKPENMENDITQQEDQIAFEESVKLRGIPLDYSLQEEDLNSVFNVAPGEGQRPIHIVQDEDFEIGAFPNLFPTGAGAYKSEREVRLTLKKYLNQRVLNCDGRFSKDLDYIMSGQYAVEQQQVYDKVNIVLRQTKGTTLGGNRINAGLIKHKENVNSLIRNDSAYQSLTDVRGSPVFWSKVQHDVMAMLRQLGKPTWFLTLSAADMQWPEVIQAIGFQYGHHFSSEDVLKMTYADKCMWLRTNPVTAARQFNYRLDMFFKDFLLKAHPLGEISDYFVRIEFQARGSPHAHMLLWVKDAPEIDKSSDREVIRFIDTYQTCSVPKDDLELKELVSKRQTHIHSSTCRRFGSCRFNFPHAPSKHTVIAKEVEEASTLESAKQVLKKVMIVIDNKDFDSNISFEDTMALAGVDESQYHKALAVCKSGKKIVLRRAIDELWTNYYNPDILKTWKANMDLQYIVDAYSCVMYVASYVLKSERAMSETLKAAAKECETEEISVQLRKVGRAFLTHREVSCQESAYRLLSIPMKKSSKMVIFVNTNPPEKRISMMKSSKKLENLEDGDENIFETSLIDRYVARPSNLEDLCLAEFAAWYTPSRHQNSTLTEVESTPEINERKSVITLQKELGKMHKRSSPAVIRFSGHRYAKNDDLRYRHKLFLYLPWRNEDSDLMKHFVSYKLHYEYVKACILENENKFSKNQDSLEEAMAMLEAQGPPEHAWDELAPGTECKEAEDEDEGHIEERHLDRQDMEEATNIGTDTVEENVYSKFTTEANKDKMTPSEYRSYFDTLNEKQKLVVSYNRKWCKDAVGALKSGKPVKPYYIFLSGCGGVGKSHVIRMISHDIVKFFSQSGKYDPEDIPVILTGPTGTSAFAIGGITLHSAFRLGLHGTNQYMNLSRSLLNTLHGKLGKLQLVIIDEVSMVGNNMIYHIHRRLQEIMGKENENSYFGDVSVLAVGDLHQLRPVKQAPIFHQPSDSYAALHGSIWKQQFLLCELTEQMRQTDLNFAETLNRIRVGEFTTTDLDMLKTRTLKYNDERYKREKLFLELHLFATNKDVKCHNETVLGSLIQEGVDLYTIQAIDSSKDKTTNLVDVKLPDNPSETGGLQKTLLIAIGSKVMLTYNIDVGDGLVNGACGLVQGILHSASLEVHTLMIKFDSNRVGISARNKSIHKRDYPDAVPITQVHATFRIGRRKALEVSRKQFPIKLAWGLTIHKVQGLTVDKAIVSMAGRFQAGQAYVALSRVTTLNGLFITDFDPQKLKADESVKSEMKRLSAHPLIIPEKSPLYMFPASQYLFLAHLNVACYLEKLQYIQKAEWKDSDILCFTETWLQDEHILHTERNIFRKDRSSVPGLEDIRHGGVLVLASCICMEIPFQLPSLEAIAVTVEMQNAPNLNILVVYRKPTGVSLNIFFSSLEQAINILPNGPTIVIGDFNSDLLFNISVVHEFMKSKGYYQHVQGPTSDRGTCIDHVYSRDLSKRIAVDSEDTYFSDHHTLLVAVEI